MNDIITRIINRETVFYKNEQAEKNPMKYLAGLDFGMNEIMDAEKRMTRFAPVIDSLFPETKGGIIESPFISADKLASSLYPDLKGSLWLKLDSHLEVAGSIKARGGIYEVLKVTEEILFKEELIDINDDYIKMLKPEIRAVLADYTISVASTGNLGLSIGIIGASLGFKSRVHMSGDAKKWKKDRLRLKGVEVIEHDGDFTYAAYMGRKEAADNEKFHFVDDERSSNLFMGYAVSALRIGSEFKKHGITPTKEKPLILYIPCGVGGAPGGITFGFKHVFNDAVECYFAEPVSSPSMLLGVLTKKYGETNVNDYGLDNITELDGLAVASPSDFVAPLAEKLCNGFYTINDDDMFKYLYMLDETENIRIEPSAAAGIPGPLATENLGRDAYHIIWTTGGLFVPDDIYDKMYLRGKIINENSRI
jgi:D-serine dehydratase